MASELPIQTILNIGDLSSVLSSVANQKNTLFKGATLDPMLPRTIYRIKRSLALRFSANPTDTTIRGVAEYLLQLCGPYALQSQTILNNLSIAFPVLTGPVNESIHVGDSAEFSVSVTGTGPFTFAWFKNGVLVPGETTDTLLLVNQQLSNNGDVFSVQVTNARGTVTSNSATLTVTASLVGFYYQGTTDYSTLLLAGTDSVAYLGTFSITTGQPLSVTFPDLGSDTEFIVVKYPATETTKTSYLNPPPSGPDAGIIPLLALNSTSFGGWKYIFSRTGTPFGMNNINGTVRFS
jgi:hypothetical protein